MPLILVHGKQRQRDLSIQGQSSLHREFWGIQGYTEILSQKNKQTKKKENVSKTMVLPL